MGVKGRLFSVGEPGKKGLYTHTHTHTHTHTQPFKLNGGVSFFKAMETEEKDVTHTSASGNRERNFSSGLLHIWREIPAH